MSSNIYKKNFFHYFININTGKAVLNIIAQASGFTKLIFARWKTRNSMSSPIPKHENSRFWLFRDKFVIVVAVLNIIVQATAFASFFLHKDSKNERAIGYLKIVFFWTTLMLNQTFCWECTRHTSLTLDFIKCRGDRLFGLVDKKNYNAWITRQNYRLWHRKKRKICIFTFTIVMDEVVY